MLLAGFPVVASFAARDGLLQTLTADAFRGRVFGALGAIQGLAILVGLTLGAVAIDAIGVVPVVSLGAAMWIVGGVFALTRLAPESRRYHGEEPRLNRDDSDAQARLIAEVRDIWDAKAAFWDEHMGEGNAFQLELIGPAVERLLAVRPERAHPRRRLRQWRLLPPAGTPRRARRGD